MLAPAHAWQATPQHPTTRCEASGKPCPGAAARLRGKRAHGPTPECRRLRTAITESEQAERRTRTAVMEAVQQDLFILRKRYKTLGC